MVMRAIAGVLRNNRGAALIEFVLVLPILLLLVFGATEFVRFMLINLKVQSASGAMANIVSQFAPATSNTPTSGEISLNTLEATLDGNALNKMLEPFGALPDHSMIITSIRREGAQTVVKWEIILSGNFRGVTSSVTGKTVGSPSAFRKDQLVSFTDSAVTASLANMLPGENLIAVEVFYNYAPLSNLILGDIDTTSFLSARTISHITLMRPRDGDLICLPSTAFPNAFVYPNIPADPGRGIPASLIGCQ